MAMTRVVSMLENGVRVSKTLPVHADEEAELRSRWESEAAEQQQREAAREAKRQADAAKLADTPANVNSVPALRDELNAVKEILRERFGV